MNERIVRIEELKELREKYLKAKEEEEKTNRTSSLEENDTVKSSEESTSIQKEGPQLVKSNPSIPSLLDKTGFSNVLYLAAMSLMFEVLFLAVAFLIYK